MGGKAFAVAALLLSTAVAFAEPLGNKGGRQGREPPTDTPPKVETMRDAVMHHHVQACSSLDRCNWNYDCCPGWYCWLGGWKGKGLCWHPNKQSPGSNTVVK
jgi:hypothetical protein